MSACFTISIGLVSLIAVLWFIWRKRRMSLFERLGIPGPKPHLITGNINDSSQQGDLAVEWEQKYGKIYGIFTGGWPFIVVSDVELLKLIQIKEYKKFSGRTKFIHELAIPHSLSHYGLFYEDGESWKNARNAISPAFTSGKLKMMIPLATNVIDIFLKKIEETGQKTFDIVPLFKRVSFDINSRVCLGVSTDVQNNDESLFVRSVFGSFDEDSNDFLAKLLIYFPELDPLPQLLRIIRDKIRGLLKFPCATNIVENCMEIIKMRRANPQAARPDLIQALIDASRVTSDNRKDANTSNNTTPALLSEEEVIANAYGFMISGYDGIYIVLSFCIQYLVDNPKVQDKLREEIKENITDKVDYDSLSKLTYLDQVLSETLRVFPFTVIVMNRKANEDFKYQGITIPKGMNIAIPLYTLNMNPEYWKEPEKFMPERFSPEKEKYINTTVYQPFGNGPRNCVAMRFAQVFMKCILASLVQKYKLVKPADAKEFELNYSVFANTPKHGIQVQAIPV